MYKMELGIGLKGINTSHLINSFYTLRGSFITCSIKKLVVNCEPIYCGHPQPGPDICRTLGRLKLLFCLVRLSSSRWS